MPPPLTEKADLVGVHREVARTEFALRKGNGLVETGDLFPVERFENSQLGGKHVNYIFTLEIFKLTPNFL